MSQEGSSTANSSAARRALLQKVLAERVHQPSRAELTSYGQRALWFIHRLAPRSAAYNLAFAARIHGPLDREALEAAFQHLVERHAQLRTFFEARDGEPVQRKLEDARIPFETDDVGSLDEESIRARMAEYVQLRFELSNGPLVRVFLLAQSPTRHIVLLVTHQIIMDARSLDVLLRELDIAYRALRRGEAPRWSNPAGSYDDFVGWQQSFLTSEEGAAQERYWMDQLDVELPFLNFPLSYARPDEQSYRGGSHSVAIPDRVAKAVAQLARAEKTTRFVVVLAAFQAFIARYSGQDDIIVGTPMAGRSQTDFHDVVGCLVNPVPLRSDLSGDPTFRSIVRQARETVLGAIENQDFPFPLLVERLQPTRARSRSPIFQAILDWHQLRHHSRVSRDADIAVATSDALELEPLAVAQQEGQMDLALDIFEETDWLEGVLKYDAALIGPERAASMARHFTSLLEKAVEAPETRLSALPLLGERERKRILVDWNATSTDYPDDTIHGLFEQQAERTPEAIAIADDVCELSFQELDRRADCVARALSARGVSKDVPVGIFMERSVDLVAALLGILKAGGAYVPLDPSYPRARIEFMVQDVAAPVLVTQESLSSELPEGRFDVLTVDSAYKSTSAPAKRASVGDPANLAYVIYTSGSTGTPKGVEVEHRNVVNFLNSMRRRPGMNAADTLLSVTTISFDIHALEIFLPLVVGGKLVITAREVATDGRRLLDRLSTSGATIMQATPTTWQLLVASEWRNSDELKILCGGEALSPSLARELTRRGRSVWNMYGPTETTIWSAVHCLDPTDTSVAIGRPIDNTQLYVLSGSLEPCPVGVTGELYIGGDGVTRGYRGREALTRERFVLDPFARRPGARFYRSGDLARYGDDGTIEVLGRLDHQVKLRGYRIELGEVEAVLCETDAVSEAVVMVREMGEDARRLVAYVNGSGDAETAALRAQLKTRLPAYMIPSHFVWLDRFPKAPNGKTDRNALPLPDTTTRSASTVDEAALSPIEKTLVDIVRDVLEVDSVAIYDNFYELGGHSLLSMKVVDAFEKQTGSSLSPEALVHETFKQIAAQYAPATKLAAAKTKKHGVLGALKARLLGHFES